MKRLFIAVSIIAVIYLGAQTDTAKTVIKAISSQASIFVETNEETNIEGEQLTPVQSVKQNDVASAQEQKMLSQRILLLEENISRLESKLQMVLAQTIDDTNLHVDNASSSKADTTLVNVNRLKNIVPAQTRDVVSVTSNEQETRDVDLTSQDHLENIVSSRELDTQQQKRIEQQAILRALSQKMELAALNSLSS